MSKKRLQMGTEPKAYRSPIHPDFYVLRGEDVSSYYKGKFLSCDVEGIETGEELEHIGDAFDTLEEAISDCDYYARNFVEEE